MSVPYYLPPKEQWQIPVEVDVNMKTPKYWAREGALLQRYTNDNTLTSSFENNNIFPYSNNTGIDLDCVAYNIHACIVIMQFTLKQVLT